MLISSKKWVLLQQSQIISLYFEDDEIERKHIGKLSLYFRSYRFYCLSNFCKSIATSYPKITHHRKERLISEVWNVLPNIFSKDFCYLIVNFMRKIKRMCTMRRERIYDFDALSQNIFSSFHLKRLNCWKFNESEECGN